MVLHLLLTVALAPHVGWAAAAPAVDFNFQVRPILADRCFNCHGPDERARKAKLRLDLREAAVAGAIVPGQPEASELYQRIVSADPNELMPPPDSKLTLSAEEKEVLRRWIEEGAEYQPHWAFVPPPATFPAATGSGGNPIDAFVSARLAKAGLARSPEAGREVLIRRLSLDLRGLPPSLEEVDQFVEDRSPGAYERLVERLLASPAYGEHQAKGWMDLARFADTYGYQSDVERDLSPWRDWVIWAFNENLPYDQFILWQLAGDLLPGATRDQVLATAFNRLHRQTNEGGSIDEEFRAEYVADRVETVGTAFLGLTLACARCHDHKYDPITQRDFYRMAAFFNNIDESGLYSHFTAATPSPSLLLYRAGEEAKHEELRRRIREAEQAEKAIRARAATGFERWLAEGGRPRSTAPVAAYDFEVLEEGKTYDRVETNRVASLVDGPEAVVGRRGRAVRFSGDNAVVLKGVGAFDRTSALSFSLWLQPAEVQPRAVVFHRSRAWTDAGSRGYELLLEEGHPSFALVHFWPGNAIRVRAKRAVPADEWSHLVVTYDGSSRAAGITLFLNGERMEVETVRDHLFKDIVHRSEWGDGDVGHIELTLAGRFRDAGFRHGAIDEFEVYDRRLTEWEVRRLFDPQAAGRSEEMREYYLQEVDSDCRQAAAELAFLRAEENRLVNDIPEIMVMREMSPRRETHLLKRGAYDAPGDLVEPGTPEAVLAFPNDLPANRLGLAQWMVSEAHPLTARVAVNRVWRGHFGRGLVETTEDFGVQGSLPSHPELLDWLARDFVRSGWDLKALHRRIVTSVTYRQTSRCSAEVAARDPDNRWLARGPKHRLEAEQIRDQALAISGLLAPRVGGPSVRPYQPAGLWEQAGTGKQYTQDKGENLYRRSLYTFWRRTSPPPAMLIFDAPSREVCVARRETTATPLQALVLLNDPQFVEAARVLAERLVQRHAGSVDARVVDAFRLATGRRPTERELTVLRGLYGDQLREFEANPAAAESLLRVGDFPRDAAVPAGQVAALATVVSSIMNLDEFVTKR